MEQMRTDVKLSAPRKHVLTDERCPGEDCASIGCRRCGVCGKFPHPTLFTPRPCPGPAEAAAEPSRRHDFEHRDGELYCRRCHLTFRLPPPPGDTCDGEPFAKYRAAAEPAVPTNCPLCDWRPDPGDPEPPHEHHCVSAQAEPASQEPDPDEVRRALDRLQFALGDQPWVRTVIAAACAWLRSREQQPMPQQPHPSIAQVVEACAEHDQWQIRVAPTRMPAPGEMFIAVVENIDAEFPTFYVSACADTPEAALAKLYDDAVEKLGVVSAATEELTPEGGRHNVSPYALDVVPKALLRIGAVFFHGERARETAPQQVGEENWRRIRARMHVRHALNHVAKWLAGDRTEDHLEHAACRLLMAIEREQEAARG